MSRRGFNGSVNIFFIVTILLQHRNAKYCNLYVYYEGTYILTKRITTRTTPARVAFTGIRTTLRRFFNDISDYTSKSGSNVFATTPQPAGYPDSMSLLGATLKKVRGYANSASCILCSSVRLVRHSTTLYTGISLV